MESSQHNCSKFTVLPVVAFIVLFWGLMCLPTIFYAVPPPQDSSSSHSIEASSCLSSEYTGSVCRSSLLGYQNCIPSLASSSSVYIANGDVQTEQENIANQILSGLKQLGASEACTSEAIPFLCLYSFGLCDESGKVHLPSRSQCLQVSEDVCAKEWKTALALLGADQLPQCDLLPEKPFQCKKFNESIQSEIPAVATVEQNATELNCSKDFYYNPKKRICLPECGKWTTYSTRVAQRKLADVFFIFCCSLSILLGVVMLIIACMNHKKMLKFPSVLTVYTTFSALLLDVTFLIAYTDRTRLFCSSKNLVESIQKPTPFCTFTGVVAVYVIPQTVYWLLFHTTALFWGVHYPFHFKNTIENGKMKYIHFTILALTILLPCIPFIVILSNGGYNDNFFILPLCSPVKKSITAPFFFAVVLPISVVLAVGVALMAITLRTIFKTHSDSSSSTTRTPEIKLFLLLCYYVTTAMFYLIAACSLYWQIDNYTSGLGEYFSCEGSGMKLLEECDKRGFQSAVFPELFTIGFGLLALFPVTNLLYAIDVQRTKSLWKRSKKTIGRNVSSKRNNGTNIKLEDNKQVT